jgi:hypothetical protein
MAALSNSKRAGRTARTCSTQAAWQQRLWRLAAARGVAGFRRTDFIPAKTRSVAGDAVSCSLKTLFPAHLFASSGREKRLSLKVAESNPAQACCDSEGRRISKPVKDGELSCVRWRTPLHSDVAYIERASIAWTFLCNGEQATRAAFSSARLKRCRRAVQTWLVMCAVGMGATSSERHAAAASYRGGRRLRSIRVFPAKNGGGAVLQR